MVLDPAVFLPEAIDQESRALIEQLRALAASAPPMHTQTPAQVRAARAGGRGPGGQPIVYSDNAVLRRIPGYSCLPVRGWDVPRPRRIKLESIES